MNEPFPLTEYSAYSTSRSQDDRHTSGIDGKSHKRLSNDHKASSSPSDNGIIQVGRDGLEFTLVQDFDDAVLEEIGRWSQSASLGAPDAVRVSDNPREYLEGGLAGQSLEDIRVAFAVRGASRALTHQLVRTRQAAFKQQSQRDSWYGYHPEFRMPESIWNGPQHIRESWITALMQCHYAYNAAVDANVTYEDARYILPEGTTNFILCEYSLRVFIETYAYRGCVMFMDEYVAVIRAMRQLLIDKHPYLAKHIVISCEKIHKCTFQGRETVEETCTFPWAKEELRLFRPSRY
jgi:hypothetical protein